jgi:hypothetical protein
MMGGNAIRGESKESSVADFEFFAEMILMCNGTRTIR